MVNSIDPATGLPELPAPYVWRVEKLHQGFVNGYYLRICEPRVRESTYNEVSWQYGLFGKRKVYTPRAETITEYIPFITSETDIRMNMSEDGVKRQIANRAAELRKVFDDKLREARNEERFSGTYPPNSIGGNSGSNL